MSAHPWSLVAPWYRWPRYPGVAPPATPPVIQKYESSQLVDMFRANPQHSLQFTGEDRGADKRLKLFLAQHKRFYLVVCELHCDRRGFPNARADDVCQAGFVLRRQRTPVPEELRKDASRLLTRIGKRRTQIEMLKSDIDGRVAGGAPSAIGVRQIQQHVKRQTYAEQRLERLHGELAQFAQTNKLTPVLQGWTPSELEGLGSWSRIEDDAPRDGDEQVYPMFKLVHDPKLTPHAARGRSIYFGLVPTAGSETDADGAPRLEPKVAYELQCFVRRHDSRCPRKPGGGRDCRGELTWSAPTAPFTLASPQDLVGTSNRPVTVHLPDLPELLDQARKLPFGAGAPLKMLSPEGSALPVVVDKDGKPQRGTPGPFQICSFAIPLITLVAFFVFRLFLPIVVLLFGLWPLLKLKFCIPPSISLGLETQLAASLQGFKAGVAVDGTLVKTIGTALNTAPVYDPLKPNALPTGMPGSGYSGAKFGDMVTALTPGELVEIAAAQGLYATDPVFGPRPPVPPGTVPSPNSLLAPLVWEPELPIPPIPDFEEAA